MFFKIFSIDLLVFYLADFEGCNVDARILKLKNPIYTETFNMIASCLNEFYEK